MFWGTVVRCALAGVVICLIGGFVEGVGWHKIFHSVANSTGLWR